MEFVDIIHIIYNYYGVCLTLSSAALFVIASNILRITKLTEPHSTQNNDYLAWKWRNFLISFIHSVVTGIGVIYCFYEEPLLKDEMLTTYSQSAYLLVCFSEGYFIYDIFEMMKFGYKGSYEIIAHHIMIVSCFTITVLQYKYLGYCCTALTIELHNIFLHFRQLLNIANVPRQSTLYRTNRIVNIVSFVAFRMLALIWIAKCLIEHQSLVPNNAYAVAVFSFVVIFIMTCVLLYRLINSDFRNQRTHSSNEANELNENKNVSEPIVNNCSSNGASDTKKLK